MNITPKKDPTIKDFAIVTLFILFFILYALTMARVCEAADHIWTMMIEATGQVVEDPNVNAYNTDTVFIGIDPNERVSPHPPQPPYYTVYMYLQGDLMEDYLPLGSQIYIWNLVIKIENQADSNLPGYFPELSWNPNDIGPGSKMEFRLDNENGDLLVADMRTENSYQTKQSDLYSYDPNKDDAVIYYSIVFAPPTWYRDGDKDGCGDPNNTTQNQYQPSGYVSDPCDCDDADPDRFQGNPEFCDGKDNDCDGMLPEDEWDEDGDGIIVCKGDCNDNDPNSAPTLTSDGYNLQDLAPGANNFTSFRSSCSPYTSYDLLKDLDGKGITIQLHTRKIITGAIESTYWFFGRVSGKEIDLSGDVSPDPYEDYVLDRF